jgi:hypothetical protein
VLARGVVGTDEQIADDRVLCVAQRRDGHHRRGSGCRPCGCRSARRCLRSARGLEHQRLEAGVIGVPSSTLSALARAMTSCGSEMSAGVICVHHVGGGVAEHPLGADVEDLDDALRVGGDAREVGAVKDRTLKGPRVEERLPVSNAYVGGSRISSAFPAGIVFPVLFVLVLRRVPSPILTSHAVHSACCRSRRICAAQWHARSMPDICAWKN